MRPKALRKFPVPWGGGVTAKGQMALPEFPDKKDWKDTAPSTPISFRRGSKNLSFKESSGGLEFPKEECRRGESSSAGKIPFASEGGTRQLEGPSLMSTFTTKAAFG